MNKIQYYDYNIKTCYRIDKVIANIAIGVFNVIIMLLNGTISLYNKIQPYLQTSQEVIEVSTNFMNETNETIPAKTKKILTDLPVDVTSQITQFLNTRDTEHVIFTCQQFNRSKEDLAATVLTATPKKDITDDELLKIIKLYPNLTSLNLFPCYNITDAGLAHLRDLPLQSLYLSYNNSITDAGLAHLRDLPLQTLSLLGCSEITDAGLAHLSNLSLLEFLNLGMCSNITDAGLAHLSNLSFLKILNLGMCSNITDAGLAHLRDLPLTDLNINGIRSLSEAAKAPLQEKKLFTDITKTF